MLHLEDFVCPIEEIRVVHLEKETVHLYLKCCSTIFDLALDSEEEAGKFLETLAKEMSENFPFELRWEDKPSFITQEK